MCSKSVLDEITRNIYKAAVESLGEKLEKVILYGSYARGDNVDDSDIDILVVADIPADKAWETRMKISKLTGWLDLAYDVLVSLHVTDSATFCKYADDLPFYYNVMKEGVIVSA